MVIGRSHRSRANILMIKVIVGAIIIFGACVSEVAGQHDASDAVVIDLLKPPEGKLGAERRCTVEADGLNLPCNEAWYIQFRDGGRAIQFNRMTDESPVVSIFGTEIAPNKLSVGNVFLRLGDRSAPENEIEAAGECILSAQKIHCDVKASDGRHIVGRIFPP